MGYAVDLKGFRPAPLRDLGEDFAGVNPAGERLSFNSFYTTLILFSTKNSKSTGGFSASALSRFGQRCAASPSSARLSGNEKFIPFFCCFYLRIVLEILFLV